ncbi:MAG: NAD kinase [Muribaculum sp.]|nr:NAD kinase [Muribaculaceae bacterium]MCM1081601.1 NAD kinase [Muribaculum sp.]
MKIAVFGSRHQSGYEEYIVKLVEEMHIRNIQVIMADKLYSHFGDKALGNLAVEHVVAADEKCPSADFAFSIGGDGTFLRTAQWVAPSEIPIFGINTGHLGYLSDHRMEGNFNWLDLLLSGDYIVEQRQMLKVDVVSSGIADVIWPYALNEVAVLKKDTASMIEIEAYIDDVFLAQYKADGLIVSTPTGSTGYNLSVGGPILQPTAPVNVVSPVAAHSLSMRPLVVCNDSVVRLSTSSRVGSFLLSLDGRSLTLPEGVELIISKAPFVTNVVVRREHNFAETLRKKLYWGVQSGK